MSSKAATNPEEQKRIDLGKAGKLWRIEVAYKRGNEISRIELRDRTGDEVQKFCENVYVAGMTVPIAPGHRRVVSPFDILEIDCHRQDRFWGNDYV